MTVKEIYADIPYEIRKRSQAKRMSLKVSHDGRVWVSIPLRGSVEEARKFFRQNLGFVKQTLEKVAIERAAKASEAKNNQSSELIVHGAWLPLDVQTGAEFAMEIIPQPSSKLVITIPVEFAKTPEKIRAMALQYWRLAMIERANTTLPKRTLELAESLGEPLRRIAVKNQKSLWGSCVKARRSVNLNWRCVLFPDEVRDYLIIHELAHLRHANHSDAYWQQVAAWCPNFEEAEHWLKTNGKRIMAVTAEPSR